jgi:hypothetical protein
MSDTTPTVETVKTEAPSNEVIPTAAPVANAVDTAEVERLKKVAEQAQMRANQLENTLKKKAEEEEAARLKLLEENNDWKSVAEQNKAKLEAYEAERDAEQRSKELSTATSEVFSTFPTEVRELAEEMGVGLTETTEEAKEALKQRLEKIQAKVVTEKKVTPNNPSNPTGPNASKAELIERMKYGDKAARSQVIASLPGVEAMRKQAGWTE